VLGKDEVLSGWGSLGVESAEDAALELGVFGGFAKPKEEAVEGLLP
jgi:hypothetical protein